MTSRWAIAALVALAMAAPPAAARTPLPSQPPGEPFPTASWRTAPPPAGTDLESVGRLLTEAFGPGDQPYGETRALVVVRGGRIVLERYAEGYGPDTRLVSWSVAKSITQALVGVAVQDGLVDPDAPMGGPGWGADDPRATLSWRTWLQMVDGQRYVEIGSTGVLDNDAAHKLFGAGRRDVADYCRRRPLVHEPGTHWNYNSCGIVLTAHALTRTVAGGASGPDARRVQMLNWMRARLFDRIGMRAIQPEFDPNGVFYGSALMYATARDYARFGLLYLRDGVWEGERILPPGWVDFARTPGPGRNSDAYGAGWWITPPQGEGKPYRALLPQGPRDGFSAQGHQGQVVLVVPSKDLVIVRLGHFTGAGRDPWNALGDWLGKLAQAFPDRAPPPP